MYNEYFEMNRLIGYNIVLYEHMCFMTYKEFSQNLKSKLKNGKNRGSSERLDMKLLFSLNLN